MTKFFRYTVALLLGHMIASVNTLHAQSIDPYLQAIQPTGIVINWKTSTTVSNPMIRYGLTENNLNATANGLCNLITGTGYNNNYFYNTIKLKGLQPATKYYYRVISGNDSSAINSFHTLPQPGMAPNASGKLRFLIIGDNQLRNSFRYDTLMLAAKRKMAELYGPDFNDSVSFILNLGDQVDNGSLDHYENLHLKKSRYLSGVLPIQTAVGNHETYQPEGMRTYYEHFVLDSMHYKGIYSGNEGYYSFQAGNVVVIYTNTDAVSTQQLNWAKKVVDTANVDPTVKWIITIGHRPYRAEQYVSDVSPWLRDQLIPYCMTSPKFLLNVGAHHHLYARGQFMEAPAYHIISGGVAWDQYWGNTAEETNAEDVQKTIANWAYQLVEVDMVTDKADIYTYSIGGKKVKTAYSDDTEIDWQDNVLIDAFHRYKNTPPPATPEITNVFADSVQLPVTIQGSPFASTGNELLNSTEFQVSATRNFSVLEKRSFRNFEDLYGRPPGQYESALSVDQNAGVDITQYTLAAGTVANGWHYVRTRYRDRNQSWSAWSVTDSFKVYNSVVFAPAITLDSARYSGRTVKATFTNGSTDPGAWIGIYKKGQTPGSGSPSIVWQNTGGANGLLTFTLPASLQAGEYYAAYFGNGGYTQITPKVPFYFGPIPTLSTTTYNFDLGVTVPIHFSNAPNLTNDWIGVYKISDVPGGGTNSTKWDYIRNTSGGVLNINGLAKGYYFATYLLQDQYAEASERIYFSVGDSITSLSIAGAEPHQFYLGEYITTSWMDAPGLTKDWLGIYSDTIAHPSSEFISYTYFDGLTSGTRDIPLMAMPQTLGSYYLVMFTNDSYTEVSNRVHFEMIPGVPLPQHLLDFSGRLEDGRAHLLSWHVVNENPDELYTLQYSTDGKNFTTDLYTTRPIDNQNGKYSYLYQNAITGNNYYRLKMSGNGSESYSKMVKIRQVTDRDAEAGNNMISVYPNPAQSNGNSIIESPYPITQIEVMDMQGRILYQTKNVNNNKYSFFNQSLPVGTYILKIYSKEVYTAKLVISR